ncbi:cob(I)yrinic acid a,c-diamide adenosyltransferase [Sulfitobacter sp. EhC04]|uniref:cob(I)yrinic acid a,c-diamide adenosyltransferase n=1 Tax=Sulfitobacter sp. EhC04 TaxID=1849168 RepID=UPI0007F497FD|nr:cob(I)yrinic acid a,c-diamide adenosyltransferase [Sulfitobacter sp. EhC04]OAN67861.1 cob(I)yrinic acid a,c-diamide adenosyltransferase [Sulfitobacter sp. EhC04]
MTDQSHKEKMQERQTEQRKKVAELQDPEMGLVLVHTGAGKGKSSSAIGVVVRALGWKQRVGVVQFIKGKWKTGERLFFDRLGGVDWHTMGEGFTWDTQDKERDIAAAQAAFAKAREMMESGAYDLVVLDEINIAMRYEYLSVEQVIEGLEARDKQTGVILTGRDAKPELCAYADLVTEMTEVKHPFKAGIKAQKGIDF